MEEKVIQHLILDTNIFSRLGDDTEVGKKIITYLQGLIGRSLGWGLAVSEFTFFETINEIDHAREVKMADFLVNFPSYAVDKVTLNIAAHLGCIYADYYKEMRISDKLPEVGDKIIAATAYRNNGFICTANMRDFPAPFFKEFSREIFTQETRKGVHLTVIYILETQRELIDKYYKRRIDSYNRKKKSS